MSSVEAKIYAFKCDGCGKIMDRVTNSHNRRGVELKTSPEGSHLCGDCVRNRVEEILETWHNDSIVAVISWKESK